MSDAVLILSDRPIAYHPILAKTFGSVQAAVFLSQLLYWKDKGNDPEGWIYKTQKEFYEETGLSRRNQETARKILKQTGVLAEKLAGSPAKLFYRIDVNVLRSSLPGSDNLNGRDRTNKNGGTVQTGMAEPAKLSLTEITPKITAKNTAKGVEVFGPALAEYHKQTGQIVTYSMIHKPVVALMVEHGIDIQQIADSIKAYSQEKREGRFRHNLSSFLRDPLKVSKYSTTEKVDTADDLERKLALVKGEK